MVAASLIDTNVLVYRFDPRFKKLAIATKLLREGLSKDSIRIPHQAVLEFMAVATWVRIGTEPLLTQAEARREMRRRVDGPPKRIRKTGAFCFSQHSGRNSQPFHRQEHFCTCGRFAL
ncbi:MAG: hypothetical protein DMG96_17060 [Acidobacteria bacterium]|nr:MAG: hypothetical protein DMG96_17060 [Acidobacteriota bacterium]